MNSSENFLAHSDSYRNNKGRYFKIGQGAPIVLLHGFAETYEIWSTIQDELAQQFTLIIPEIPGCGNNFSFEKALSMEGIADFVDDILQQEKIEQTILFGHSMGGYAAAAFAEKYAEKLSGLSFIHSQASADSAEKKKVREQAIAFIEKNGKEQFLKTLIPKLYAGATTDYLEEKKWHHRLAQQYSSEQIMACYQAMKSRKDRTKVLSELNIPVQFILGTEDASVDLKQAISQSQLCKISKVNIFNKTGHTSFIENTSLLKKSLINFSYDVLHHFNT